MKLSYILYSIIVSCAAYILCFAFLFHKPLTVGITREYYQKKMAYLTSIDSNKLILLAGSNGRFSHSCAVIEAQTGVKCVNMSIGADISLDYQFEKIKPFINPGDVIYLPLEYGALSGTKKDMMSGAELPYIIAYDHDHLFRMDLGRIAHAMFYFDIKFLISSIGEMLLDHIGVKRRFGLDTMTLQGDESKHTLTKAVIYKTHISSMGWVQPSPDQIDETSYKASIVADFMRWATAHDVIVIGGLPTTFDDSEIPEELIRNLQEFYEEKGHYFIVMKNKSQYPRHCFYDTSYHLAEEFQIRHSKILAAQIKNIMDGK